MFKILFTLFTLLLVTIPAIAIDSDKWDLVAHQEVVPQQSFPVGGYTITLAECENLQQRIAMFKQMFKVK